MEMLGAVSCSDSFQYISSDTVIQISVMTWHGHEPIAGVKMESRVFPIPMAYNTLHLHFGTRKSKS